MSDDGAAFAVDDDASSFELGDDSACPGGSVSEAQLGGPEHRTVERPALDSSGHLVYLDLHVAFLALNKFGTVSTRRCDDSMSEQQNCVRRTANSAASGDCQVRTDLVTRRRHDNSCFAPLDAWPAIERAHPPQH